jgi:hypothetical protein
VVLLFFFLCEFCVVVRWVAGGGGHVRLVYEIAPAATALPTRHFDGISKTPEFQ